MDNEHRFLQRYGGHLILVAIALLLIAGSKTRAVTQLFNIDNNPAEASRSSSFSIRPTPTRSDSHEDGPPPEFDISELPVLADSSLSPAPVPITYKPKKPQHEFITYTVQAGDTAIGIAEQFGIREETILGGNSFLANDAGQLWAGTTITILPTDGVLHDVVEGDTLEGIAERYGVPVEDIIAYESNNLEFPYRLYPSTQVLVPGAVAEAWVWDPPSLVASDDNSSPEALQGIQILVPGTGTFVRPWNGGRITQNPWYGHMAIDVGLVTGSPIFASDTGTVTYATWSPYCYGNLVVINHGNGFETFYAHLNGFNVTPGQTVYQGQLIAWSGNTGCSTGPHVHFEIRYLKQQENPWTYIP
jgi:LysM repeat protein